LIRDGRIDKKITVGIPNKEMRKEIINIHIKGKPYKSLCLDKLNNDLKGYTGAKIENLLNEAMLHALRNGKTFFTETDIDFIMNKHLGTMQYEFTDKQKRQIVVHESGHALMGVLCDKHCKMIKATVNWQSNEHYGYTLFEKSEVTVYFKEELFGRLMILLSGYIAEELLCEDLSNLSVNDVKDAKNIAERMIVEYGMGLNMVNYFAGEKMKNKMDDEINHLLNRGYYGAKYLLETNYDLLVNVTNILEKNKVITYEEIKKFT
jgi:cell division protease FtsH